mmetsp:Transcript_28100/g.70569  ORF Transcript_28100/g.70569 Transcript_28100/m.70569 type:complete len:219 (-) Transcript_28100:25-681(-)
MRRCKQIINSAMSSTDKRAAGGRDTHGGTSTSACSSPASLCTAGPKMSRPRSAKPGREPSPVSSQRSYNLSTISRLTNDWARSARNRCARTCCLTRRRNCASSIRRISSSCRLRSATSARIGLRPPPPPPGPFSNLQPPPWFNPAHGSSYAAPPFAAPQGTQQMPHQPSPFAHAPFPEAARTAGCVPAPTAAAAAGRIPWPRKSDAVTRRRSAYREVR